MRHEVLSKHLALAERHISQGEEHVRRQQELIERLGRGGHDTRQAKDLLQEFERLLTLHKADRDRILEELGAATG